MFDGKAFGEEIVSVVKAHVEKTVAPLLLQIEAMRAEIDGLKTQPAPLPAPELPGIPAMIADAIEAAKPEPVDIKGMIDEAIAALPPAEKGKDADPVEVAAQIAEEVERAVAALPAPQDGKSVTVDEMRPIVDEAIAKAVAALPVAKDGIDGRDGRDADPAETARLLAQKANDNYAISDGEFASRVSICLGKVVEIRSSPLTQPDTRPAVA